MTPNSASTLRSDQGILKRVSMFPFWMPWSACLNPTIRPGDTETGGRAPGSGGRVAASTLRSDQGILKLVDAYYWTLRLEDASTLRSDQGILKLMMPPPDPDRSAAVPQPYDPTRGY